MVEAKKATATKTKSCYAVTRQAGIAEGTALKLGSYHRKITASATKTIVQALLQEQYLIDIFYQAHLLRVALSMPCCFDSCKL